MKNKIMIMMLSMMAFMFAYDAYAAIYYCVAAKPPIGGPRHHPSYKIPGLGHEGVSFNAKLNDRSFQCFEMKLVPGQGAAKQTAKPAEQKYDWQLSFVSSISGSMGILQLDASKFITSFNNQPYQFVYSGELKGDGTDILQQSGVIPFKNGAFTFGLPNSLPTYIREINGLQVEPE